MTRIVLALIAMCLIIASGSTAAAADASKGERLAQRWCDACHLISSSQQQGNTSVAPFSEIARQPGLNAGRVALFLLAPHPKMPDMNLSREEAADLAAYIAAQKK